MATERLPMKKAKEILRLKYELKLSHRTIAAAIGVGVGTVGMVSSRAQRAALTWEEARALTEEAIEARLYTVPETGRPSRPLPDFTQVHAERKRPGVTLELLHLEYLAAHPGGYKLSQFYDLYRTWLGGQEPPMRQRHRPGEKLFVDYSGDRAEIVDATTGRILPVELFVAVMGASSFVYAEATLTQQVGDFIGSHVRAFVALGGVPAMLVPDQLKSGVTVACAYEPAIQRTYADMAEHYGACVLPARPKKPRDKAKVESGVLQVQRWVLARLRNQVFFSLAELNERIRELVAELNARTMKAYRASRRELFDRLDRPALRPLPDAPYEVADWRHATVNLDYHVGFELHFYSVPYRHARERVEVRATAAVVEVLLRGERIASHRRSDVVGGHTTEPAHMPASHRRHAEWSPSRFISWAAAVGPHTERLVTAILADRPHPEMGYRSCLGILRLARHYDAVRLEAASRRAHAAGIRSYRSLNAILAHGLDRLEVEDAGVSTPPADHENVRGRDYFH